MYTEATMGAVCDWLVPLLRQEQNVLANDSESHEDLVLQSRALLREARGALLRRDLVACEEYARAAREVWSWASVAYLLEMTALFGMDRVEEARHALDMARRTNPYILPLNICRITPPSTLQRDQHSLLREEEVPCTWQHRVQDLVPKENIATRIVEGAAYLAAQGQVQSGWWVDFVGCMGGDDQAGVVAFSMNHRNELGGERRFLVCLAMNDGKPQWIIPLERPLAVRLVCLDYVVVSKRSSEDDGVILISTGKAHMQSSVSEACFRELVMPGWPKIGWEEGAECGNASLERLDAGKLPTVSDEENFARYRHFVDDPAGVHEDRVIAQNRIVVTKMKTISASPFGESANAYRWDAYIASIQSSSS